MYHDIFNEIGFLLSFQQHIRICPYELRKTVALSFIHGDKRLLSTDSVPNQPDTASNPADKMFDNSE